MAFPTSSLTNNQVHKEGNRAFVYDSALGVWDQVKETDRTENKIFSGEVGEGTTFPSGHVINYELLNYHYSGGHINTTNTSSFVNTGVAGSFITKRSSSESFLEFEIWSMMMHNQSSNYGLSTMTLKTEATKGDSWSEAYDLLDPVAYPTYRNYTSHAGVHYQNINKYHHYAGKTVPSAVTTYTAGQKLYWRCFMRSGGSNTYYWYHASSAQYITLKEIMK